MNKERDRKQWDTMILQLTDPEERNKTRRKEMIKKRIEQTKLDTGIC